MYCFEKMKEINTYCTERDFSNFSYSLITCTCTCTHDMTFWGVCRFRKKSTFLTKAEFLKMFKAQNATAFHETPQHFINPHICSETGTWTNHILSMSWWIQSLLYLCLYAVVVSLDGAATGWFILIDPISIQKTRILKGLSPAVLSAHLSRH